MPSKKNSKIQKYIKQLSLWKKSVRNSKEG